MPTTESDVLGNIIDIAQTHLERLESARNRPDVDLDKLARSALDMLLEGICAELAPLKHNSAVSAGTRHKVYGFTGKLEAYLKASVRVDRHLLRLAEDWQCAACTCRIPKEAAISGVQVDSIEVTLVCKDCGKETALTRRGKAAFDEVFGHLAASPIWNPRPNGFRWDGR